MTCQSTNLLEGSTRQLPRAEAVNIAPLNVTQSSQKSSQSNAMQVVMILAQDPTPSEKTNP